MPFHILHLANDFPGSQVYKQLVQAIDRQGICQTVFTTIRAEEEKGKNDVTFSTKESVIYYSDNWRSWHKISFRSKNNSNYKNLLRVIDPQKITHVHAHTLFSDGALALKLKKVYGIPYTVTIRNTDLNTFMRFMVHTWGIGRAVMLNADRIICISPAHINRVKEWFCCPRQDFNQKVVNIPNGIDSYWIDHLSCQTHGPQEGDPWRVLYIGNFTSNKNLPRLMEGIRRVKDKMGINIELHIIGGNGEDEDRILSLASAYPDIYHMHGIIRDKDRIRAIMQHCNLYAMPSLHETFGLVYVEALSQGLPILYTQGEGVDGFFSLTYGEQCRPTDVEDIVRSISRMITNFNSYRIYGDYLAEHFDWDHVAAKYLSIFSLLGYTNSNYDQLIT